MKRTRLPVVPLAMLFAVAACSDDDPVGVTGDALNEDEAAALAEVLAGTLFTTFSDNPGPLPAPALVTGSFSLETTVPCDISGSVAVNGNVVFDIDDTTGEGTLDYTWTGDHQNCVAESEDGHIFTVNGAPNVTASFLITLTSTVLTFAGDYVGGVQWATGDKSGTCTVDVDFSFTGDPEGESGTAMVSGNVCGVTFSQTLIIN